MKKDKYEEITQNVVESLEAIAKGEMEKPSWIRPWSSIGAPRNAFNNRPYRGMNAWILSLKMGQMGWDDARFATYNAIKKAGGQVKKGEKSTMVVLWKFLKKTDKDTGEEKTIPFLRSFNVFNVKDQSEGIELKAVKEPNKDERDAKLEEIFSDLNAEIKTDHRAAYYPLSDHIGMPSFKSFKSAPDYYAVLSHELAHWTGHSSRLDRELIGRFGNESYAMEELIAELTSSFVCQELGIDGMTNKDSLAYLHSWIKVLKNDSRAIFTASSKARHAVKYLIGKHIETQQEEDMTL